MGDSRAQIKIEFSIYGETYKADMSINYFPNDGSIDDRVRDFFDVSYRKARSKFDELIYECEAESRAKAEEAAERAELVRLKQKYGTPP